MGYVTPNWSNALSVRLKCHINGYLPSCYNNNAVNKQIENKIT